MNYRDLKEVRNQLMACFCGLGYVLGPLLDVIAAVQIILNQVLNLTYENLNFGKHR